MEQQTENTQEPKTTHPGSSFEQFGENMAAWGENFGQHMASWGEEFGRQMEVWAKEFEKRMASWGQDFGPRMESWAEDLGQRMQKVGGRVNEWFEGEPSAGQPDAGGLQKERMAILRMVQEGKISVSEAEGLLRALGK